MNFEWISNCLPRTYVNRTSIKKKIIFFPAKIYFSDVHVLFMSKLSRYCFCCDTRRCNIYLQQPFSLTSRCDYLYCSLWKLPKLALQTTLIQHAAHSHSSSNPICLSEAIAFGIEFFFTITDHADFHLWFVYYRSLHAFMQRNAQPFKGH